MENTRCLSCKNYIIDLKCLAFPESIPEEILLGENDHSKPILGQVNEIVFEENDMQKCYTNMYDNLSKRVESLHTSYHPNFDSKDVFKMLKENHDKYPYKKLLNLDRVGQDGSILHPYGAVKKGSEWHIKTFELFTKEYDTMLDEEFVLLPLSSQEAMKVRKEYLEKKQ